MTTEALLLLTWLSPAFPTGAYAYSHGIERAVEAGDVRCEGSAGDWIEDAVRDGAGRSDAILLRHAHRARSPQALAEAAELAAAAQPCRERRLETLAQGSAFSRAAEVWSVPGEREQQEHRFPLPLPLEEGRGEGRADAPKPVAYPIALGAHAAAHGIAEDAAALGLLHAFCANLVSACVRLVPLGQTAGLRVQARLAPTLLAVADETRFAGLDDVGGACFRSDIASMRHETQQTRLFRT